MRPCRTYRMDRVYTAALYHLCVRFFFSVFFSPPMLCGNAVAFLKENTCLFFLAVLFCILTGPANLSGVINNSIWHKRGSETFSFLKKEKRKKEKEEEMKKMSLKSQRRPPGCHMKPQSTLCKASMCHYVVYIMCLLFKLNYS